MLRNSCMKNLSSFRTQVNRHNNLKQFLQYNLFDFALLRHIFGAASIGDRKKVYDGRKLVGFSMEQMYSVVSDVGNYYQFVPFCKKSHVTNRKPEHLIASLVIGFPPIIESYTSHVTLVEPRMVKAECIDGKLFDHLDTIWKFTPALRNNPQSCVVDFHISFEFRSLVHSHLASLFFDRLVHQMEGAFINEARARYGKESIPSQNLNVVRSRS